ncbi:MAG TPA: hypothetical protein VK068_04760, partial [Jeotgalicoccus sp.]|nr:hypothetical protein [Jeotgalicoccus sp.]
MNNLRMLFVSMLTLSILVACSQDDTKDKVKEDETQTTNKVEESNEIEDTADKDTESEESSDEDKELTA